jgi:IS30 family transposase
MVGPFRTAPGGYKHILVAVDKFTKWIEVRPVEKVTSEEVVKFIGDIKHSFGVPNRIITDIGAAFTGSVFWDFCQDNLIDVYYSSLAHPRSNGQVERANGIVLQALKDRINDDASNYATRWLAELPHIIWGLRTQVSSCDRLLALLSGLRIRSYTSYRRHLRGSTNLVLRGRRGRANT